MLTKAKRNFFHENGFLVIENILPADIYEDITSKLKDLKNEDYSIVENQGGTVTKRVLLDKNKGTEVLGEKAYSFIKNDFTRNGILNYVASKTNQPITYYMEVDNGTENAFDPQKYFHADAFFLNEGLVFLHDVSLEDGAFQYIPGSNQITLKRLIFEYKKSLNCSSKKEKSHFTLSGSFRYDDNEIKELYALKPKVFCVRKNTLVIADTFGLHRRSNAIPGASRKSLWFYSRTNPFLPFLGSVSNFWNDLHLYFYKKDFAKRMAQS